MRPGSSRRAARLSIAAAALALVFAGAVARAQQLEPRAYANLPIGLNFLVAGYAYSQGAVLLDPSIPVTNVSAKLNTLLLGYMRALDLWGDSGNLSFAVPYARVAAKGQINGPDSTSVASVTRDGFGDPAIRLAVNLYGAPALSAEQFKDYRQKTIIGTSLTVTAPLGQYDGSRLVNIGNNRWSLKPEAGVSRALGGWILEASSGVQFFTENRDFLGGHTRKQDPLFSWQAHAIYNFNPGLWSSVDATYYTGGRTSVDGILNSDLQQNSRLGATLGKSIGRQDAVKLYLSSGATARNGANFKTVGIAWQHRWGAEKS